MMTTTTPQSHEQVSFPGQAHVAQGPHDQTGMYFMHHALRRDLALFESAVRATPIGAADTWRALADRWARFGEILHHHHSVEDVSLWPVLTRHAERLGDEAALTMLADMEAEHGVIDPTLAAVTAGFATMREHPCVDHRNALDVHVTAARAALLDHLAHEETEALPFLQRVVSVEENAAFDAAAQKAYGPRVLGFLVPWAADEVPADLVRKILDDAGKPFAVLLWLTRGRYERATRKAFAFA
jgi:hemerythrin-like domain-containing protein